MDEEYMLEYHHSSSDSSDNFINNLSSNIDDHLTYQVVDDMSLSVGRQFNDSTSFKQFIRSKAIIENFGLKFTASDRKRVIATCSYNGCPWRVRTSVCSDGQTFEVRKLEALHLCPGVNRAGNKQATSSWVAHEISDIVKRHPDIPPKQINNCLESKFGLSLPYMKIWRSREHARENIFGSVDDSYKWVPALRAELVRRNPGSHIIYDCNSQNGSFKSFFVSFKVCVDGFLNGCRHLVGLDACHLKSKYLGVLMAANSLNGNNGLFTIAFAVVESESKKTWEWFLKNLSEAFNDKVEPLSFISDMEKGLGEAMKTIFPNAEHRVCLRHLWKNIKKHFHYNTSHKIRNAMWQSANAYSRCEFDTTFSQLSEMSPQLQSYLLNLPYKWARCQFIPEIKNQYNTNNMSESFNSWIGEARGKPIVDLVDMVRGMLMEQRSQRQTNSFTWRGELTPTAEEYLRDITTRKDQFIIRQSTTNKAEVEGHYDRHEVDIGTKQCSCMYWQMTGLPCIHAVSFIGTKGDPLWHIYVDEQYYVTRYKVAYEGAIATLPGKKQWIAPDDDTQVGLPTTIRPRGRPRKRRIKSFLENNSNGKKTKRFHKCSRCGDWGHHKNTCKNALNQLSREMPDIIVDASTSEFTYGDCSSRSKLPVRRDNI